MNLRILAIYEAGTHSYSLNQADVCPAQKVGSLTAAARAKHAYSELSIERIIGRPVVARSCTSRLSAALLGLNLKDICDLVGRDSSICQI